MSICMISLYLLLIRSVSYPSEACMAYMVLQFNHRMDANKYACMSVNVYVYACIQVYEYYTVQCCTILYYTSRQEQVNSTHG